jgi:hypothetical protein
MGTWDCFSFQRERQRFYCSAITEVRSQNRNAEDMKTHTVHTKPAGSPASPRTPRTKNSATNGTTQIIFIVSTTEDRLQFLLTLRSCTGVLLIRTYARPADDEEQTKDVTPRFFIFLQTPAHETIFFFFVTVVDDSAIEHCCVI